MKCQILKARFQNNEGKASYFAALMDRLKILIGGNFRLIFAYVSALVPEVLFFIYPVI